RAGAGVQRPERSGEMSRPSTPRPGTLTRVAACSSGRTASRSKSNSSAVADRPQNDNGDHSRIGVERPVSDRRGKAWEQEARRLAREAMEAIDRRQRAGRMISVAEDELNRIIRDGVSPHLARRLER